MAESIKDIKEILKSVDDINSELLQKYKDDSRVGVQKLITQRVKQIEKRNHEIEEFNKRLKYEHEFWHEGINVIAGVDEVGRGPLAGPVVTCAVVLPHDFDVYEVNDSKQLSEKKRYELADQIKAKSIDYSYGIADNKLIDDINIYEATRVAMKEAVLGLKELPQEIIVDAMQIDVDIQQLKLIKGDAKSASVSAASILAKTYRDDLMKQYDQQYPEYDFANNAGYGTKKHLDALHKYGATPIHRRSFKPVSDLL
ncbi:ribonuclease HII [Apilactobacillus kunkeei]|uniref:ribonuclease HII n=1 Tax=Apilactobacillus kunkeei TaxID=148814 RepID=UPI00110CF059|nr:ribonuclease HII [Apilactobacillus kunkeei]TMS99180.1 ribonuclease HII [Apilactobacillus kunkeei]